MQVYYNATIQMRGTYEADDQIMERSAHYLGFNKNNIDEQEIHNAKVWFYSAVKPSEMKEKVLHLLAECNRIYYVDVTYRFEHEMVPDRFVVWQGGKTQDYTGHVMYVEDDDE